MLNAFRHQREGHVTRASRRCWRVYWCSTPFGIKEKDTQQTWRRVQSRSCAQRLSASKRRTLDTVRSGYPCSVLCSTPFGIKEKDTAERFIALLVGQSCSTPFGIKEKDTARPQVKHRLNSWCSTPFGIKEKDTPPSGPMTQGLASAQRLSASKRRTPLRTRSKSIGR